METIFTFDKQKCTGCGACSVACMDQNDIDTLAGETAYRRADMTECSGEWEIRACGCLHCRNAACMEVCPAGCFSPDDATGIVILDNDLCIGCGRCAGVCEHHALHRNREGKMEKCNGCNERVKAGLLPACVKVCQYGALGFSKG